MKILHFYSSNAPEMVSRYVKTLCEEMSSQLSNDIVTTPNEAIATLKERHYDLLHIHGCWQYGFYRAMRQAERLGTRIVVTPHGQLEPWVMKEGYWKEKLPKRLLFQHAIVCHAYAIIVQGKMEEECLSKLGWNSRTVIIRNSLITNTINAHDMAQQMQNVYRKIMDSNTLQLMTSNTRITLRQLLKVGITGDKRWLGESYVTITDHNQWRMLYCYVHHEQVADIVKRGLNILHMEAPDFDISKVDIDMASKGGSIALGRQGCVTEFDEEVAKQVLAEDEIQIIVSLGEGSGTAVCWGCDLTYDYVKINGDYRS